MKRIIKLFILVLIPINVSGQLYPVTSQYVLNPLLINPAYAGNKGALDIAAFYRRQWVGITGAPETMTLAADAPLLDSKVGLGLIITSDKLGVTKETHIQSDYSYKINMGTGSLSFGLGAGIVATNTAWSDLVALDPGDENYLTNSRVFVAPDFNAGAYFSVKNCYGGLSIPKLIGYKFNYDKNKYTLIFNPGHYNYLINCGYRFNLTQQIKLLPSTLVTVTPGEKLLIDLNAYVSLNDKIWTGVSYHSSRSLGVLFQCALSNQIRFAYTYDFDFGSLGHYSNGTHEVMLRYEFRYKVNAVSPLTF
ncbi:MAG: type IX secretion system membrane protein PorP/SprF [Bacteroidales bacterium]